MVNFDRSIYWGCFIEEKNTIFPKKDEDNIECPLKAMTFLGYIAEFVICMGKNWKKSSTKTGYIGTEKGILDFCLFEILNQSIINSSLINYY